MEVAERLEKRLKTDPLRGEFFESLEAVRTVLTEKRLALWRLIRDRHPQSILELARWVKRDFKSVHRDIGVLVAVGLIELKKGKGSRGTTQRPKSLADCLRLEVA
jgi:predicted transcriptional regulator